MHEGSLTTIIKHRIRFNNTIREFMLDKYRYYTHTNNIRFSVSYCTINIYFWFFILIFDFFNIDFSEELPSGCITLLFSALKPCIDVGCFFVQTLHSFLLLQFLALWDNHNIICYETTTFSFPVSQTVKMSYNRQDHDFLHTEHLTTSPPLVAKVPYFFCLLYFFSGVWTYSSMLWKNRIIYQRGFFMYTTGKIW